MLIFSRTFSTSSWRDRNCSTLRSARLEIERLEDVLLLVDLHSRLRRDEVGELTRLGDAVDQRARFLRQLGHQLDDPLGDVLEVHHQRVELDVASTSDRERCGPAPS